MERTTISIEKASRELGMTIDNLQQIVNQDKKFRYHHETIYSRRDTLNGNLQHVKS
ncbi:MAG: hypothetical protein M0Q38_00915 [Bacteroidales bacterium]|nr:hypothetical protein [Bacteroidales bacterium]